MFREHVAVGAILSMVVVVAVYFYALITDPLLLMFLFAVTIVGSFLPDVDSDSGMPFYLVFGTMTLGATGIVLLYTLASPYAADWRYLVGIPAAALLFFWFIVGGIIKRCTHHRGIFHSIPALAIASLGTMLVAKHYGLDETVVYAFGAAMGVGFLSHLVLDELHAGITLDGIPFNPKSSFGSAMKIFSDSTRVNLAAYLLLATLAYTVLETPMAQAFYNDSDIIEIINDAPPAPPGLGDAPAVTPGGYITPNTNPKPEDAQTNPQTPQEPASINYVAPGSESEEVDEELEEEVTKIAESLFSSGALSGSSVLDTTAIANSLSGGIFSLFIDGIKVRAKLSKEFDLRDILLSWRAKKKGNYSPRDYGLIAASTALGDSNVQSVSFTASAFEITYRSRGYLLGIFPKTFPVRVKVVPAAESGVTIRLPWYRFFVREFFTVKGLTAEIEEALAKVIAENTEEGADLNVRLFEAVAELLRNKVGTVANTLNSTQ